MIKCIIKANFERKKKKTLLNSCITVIIIYILYKHSFSN